MSSSVAHFLTLSVAESLHTLPLSWKDLVLVEFLLLSLNNWQMKPMRHRRGAGGGQMGPEEGGMETQANFRSSPHSQPNSLRNSRGVRGSACAFTVCNLPEGQGERDVTILILCMETLRYRQIWEPMDSQDAHPNCTWRIWSFNYQVDLAVSKKIKVCSCYIDLLKYWSTTYW